MLVVDKGENIPVGTAIPQDREYWIYNTRTIEGVQTKQIPGSLNLNWNRVYNVPSTSGYSSW